MNIFVDESGTFTVDAPHPGAWCVVAAYVSPECDRRHIERLVSDLRAKYGGGAEVKISALPEPALIQFLDRLRNLNGLLFAVAMDVSLHRREYVVEHQKGQVEKILKNAPMMRYPEGRAAVEMVAQEVEALPLQLYTQLMCQLHLFHAVLRVGPVYFVQRYPGTLSAFRWRVDRKDNEPTNFEVAFGKILPGILQTISLRDPMICLEGGNYKHMARFQFAPGDGPRYLQDEYGVEVDTDGSFDLGKMIREDFKLVDSAAVPGVQVADLCASGLRRLFRGRIESAREVARLFGSCMVRAERDRPVIPLIALGAEGVVADDVAALIRVIGANARNLAA